MYRAQMGAVSPAEVFLPILIATSCSTIAGLLIVSAIQRIKLTDPVLLARFAGFVVLGSVGIVKIRYAIWCGLFADLAGVIASIVVCYWFYG